MGLDSFWVVPDGIPHPIFEPKLCLVGSFVSNNKEFQGGFRGKIYADLIEDITGISIYQRRIPNKTIRKMANLLEKAELSKFIGKPITFRDRPELDGVNAIMKMLASTGHTEIRQCGEGDPITADELIDLQRMFRAYADAGARLEGDW